MDVQADPGARETWNLVWSIGCAGCVSHWSAGGGNGCTRRREMPRETDLGLTCAERVPHPWAPSNALRRERETFARRTKFYPPWTDGKHAPSLSGAHYLEPTLLSRERQE